MRAVEVGQDGLEERIVEMGRVGNLHWDRSYEVAEALVEVERAVDQVYTVAGVRIVEEGWVAGQAAPVDVGWVGIGVHNFEVGWVVG